MGVGRCPLHLHEGNEGEFEKPQSG